MSSSQAVHEGLSITYLTHEGLVTQLKSNTWIVDFTRGDQPGIQPILCFVTVTRSAVSHCLVVKQPPAIGAVITFRYQEFTDGGVPRFPSFVRVTDDGLKAAAVVGKTTLAGHTADARSPSSLKRHDAAGSSTGSKRYFEATNGKSSKFWEIQTSSNEVTVRYGRIGSDGTNSTKKFPDAAAAQKHAARLIEEKTAKGYVEN